MDSKGHIQQNKSLKKREDSLEFDEIVLQKDIFSNVFEKDIRRVYIYKKSETLAKAIQLIAPAFKDSKALRDRMQRVSVELVDAALLPPSVAKDILSRELLALTSVLRMGKTAGMLSPMNADIIMREAHNLLQEVSSYEESKVTIEDTPTLAMLAKNATTKQQIFVEKTTPERTKTTQPNSETYKGQSYIGQNIVKKDKNGRKDTILSILKSKGPSYIKDLSTMFRDVSEKTIQRELQALVLEGLITKTGERRWTRYEVTHGTSDTELRVEAVSPNVDFTPSLG